MPRAAARPRTEKEFAGLKRTPEIELALAIHRLQRTIRFDDVEAVCDYGITRTECHVLEIVALHGPLSVNEVTDHMRLNKSTVSRVIASLTEKRLIRSAWCEDDARRLAVECTQRGVELWQTITLATSACYRDVLDEATPSAREAVLRVLERLTRRSCSGSDMSHQRRKADPKLPAIV